MKILLGLVVVCAVCSFVFAVTTKYGERIVWNYADKASGGILRAQTELTKYKMKNFGQYVRHLEGLLSDQNVAEKSVDQMSWEDYRIEHARKLALELKMARALNQIIGSYLGADLN